MTKTLSTEVAISGAPPPPGRRTPGEVCGEAGQADADEAHRSVVEPSRRLDRHHLVSAVPPRGGLSLGHVPRAHVQGPGPARWPLRTCPGTRSRDIVHAGHAAGTSARRLARYSPTSAVSRTCRCIHSRKRSRLRLIASHAT